MSLPLPSDTSESAPVAPPPDASKAQPLSFFQLPLRAQLSFLRQWIVLGLRYPFRLPIDDFKEQSVQAQLDGLIQVNERAQQTISNAVAVINNMNARLKWYERHIPRMRELRREFEREQEKLRQLAQAPDKEQAQRLADGILVAETIARAAEFKQ